MKSDKDFVLPITEGQGQGVIAGVGSVESSYLIQVTSCPVDHIHPDLAAIKVFIQYLTQLEGPMWRQIRGLGLSYHYRFVKRLIIRLCSLVRCSFFVALILISNRSLNNLFKIFFDHTQDLF